MKGKINKFVNHGKIFKILKMWIKMDRHKSRNDRKSNDPGCYGISNSRPGLLDSRRSWTFNCIRFNSMSIFCVEKLYIFNNKNLFYLKVSLSLRVAVRTSADLESNMTSVERIIEYARLPAEAEWKRADFEPNSNWPNEGHIRFENYSMKYRPELDFVLKSLKFDIKPKEKVKFTHEINCWIR